MKVFIGADHRGFELKEEIKLWLMELGMEGEDVGADRFITGDDYPDYAKIVVEKMEEGDRGILFCGSGHGMDIAANRYTHIRAILAFNEKVVKQGRDHEDANVLVIPSDWVGEKECKQMIKVFLETKFSGLERHVRRVKKLGEMDGVDDL